MLQMGVPPVQIHVMSAISGVEWDEAWSDRVEGVLGRNGVKKGKTKNEKRRGKKGKAGHDVRVD